MLDSENRTDVGPEEPASEEHDRITGSTTVPDLVSRQAQRTPERAALTAGRESLTYADLERNSNRLASLLRVRGVQPGSLVGVHLDRSLDLIVALLAVWKTGAAYVPLDPVHPAARIAFMISDAQLHHVVTRDTSLRERTQVVNLDVDHDEIQAQPHTIVPLPARPEERAYVVYTSGSTGQPKGAEIGHRSLLSLVSWHLGAFGVTEKDRASQLASPAFDAMGWEVWPYLTAGASVHVVEEESRTSPGRLRDWLVGHGITIGFVPTAVVEPLLALEWPANTALRTLLTGGERLRACPRPGLPFTLVNNYGPTETTVVATSGVVRPVNGQAAPPPIGRPIANTSIYILDEKQGPVPPGTSGELYIGGDGVGLGYLNRPEMTRERFLADPFSADSRSRMYRTGDAGRLLPDGQIEFQGRLDDQIKIRGFRIEPEEIVAALRQQPGVRAAAVVLREEEAADPVLAAYVEADPDSLPSRAVLQEALSSELPDYMVPALFVAVERLPLNVNGKLDRTALPEPTASNTVDDHVFTAPRTLVEERLAEIVRTLLRLDRVSVTGNFFFLGGHSLLGTRLIARIRDAFGVELPLRRIFETPTVEALAEEIERAMLAEMGQEDDLAVTSPADDAPVQP